MGNCKKLENVFVNLNDMKNNGNLLAIIVLLFFSISSCTDNPDKQSVNIYGKWDIIGIDTTQNISGNTGFDIIFIIDAVKDNKLSLEINSKSILVLENGLLIETLDINDINNDEISYSKKSNSKLKTGIIKYTKISKNRFDFLFTNGFKYKLQKTNI